MFKGNKKNGEIKNVNKDLDVSQSQNDVKIKKNKKFKITKKKVVILVLILAVLLAIVLGNSNRKKALQTTTEVKTALAAHGSIIQTIEGEGAVEAISQYEVTALSIKGEIIGCYFEEGDRVEKGQLLYKIDSSDMEKNLESVKSNLERAQMSYDNLIKDNKKINKDKIVTSPISGVITSLSVENGDAINAGSTVATIENSQTMKLTVNFNTKDARAISAGSSAQIKLENSFSTLYGTVFHVASGSKVSPTGVEVTPIEILVENPGAIKEGDRATAIVGKYAGNSFGTFVYSQQQTINVKVSGDVKNLVYKEGDFIKEQSTLFTIHTRDYDDNYETELKSALLNLKDAQTNLENLYKDLDEYNIEAPITGEIIQRNLKAGEKLDNTNSNSPMAIIADLSTLTFDMNIDELDITKIKVGQRVDITADAVEAEDFSGYIDRISIVGSAEQGSTSYPVTVIVDSENKDLLIPGMNVSASVVTDSRENVLCIPVSAVHRGNIVIVKTAETDKANTASGGKTSPKRNGKKEDANKNANKDEQTLPKAKNAGARDKNMDMELLTKDLNIPEGYKAVVVETGLADSDYIEIVKGLKDGDIVIVPDISVPSVDPFEAMMSGGGDGNRGGHPGGRNN